VRIDCPSGTDQLASSLCCLAFQHSAYSHREYEHATGRSTEGSETG
jgi:hypothetical protein